MSEKLVYDFYEQCDGGRELLGGKGLGLAEMTGLGLPVPDGFTVSTAACRQYLESRTRAHAGASRGDRGAPRRVGAPDRAAARRSGRSHCSSPFAPAGRSRCPG